MRFVYSNSKFSGTLYIQQFNRTSNNCTNFSFGVNCEHTEKNHTKTLKTSFINEKETINPQSICPTIDPPERQMT